MEFAGRADLIPLAVEWAAAGFALSAFWLLGVFDGV